MSGSMDAFGALESMLSERHSCRAFLPEPVSAQTASRLFELGRRTPSWANVQPWHVAAVSGDALRRLTESMAAHAGDRGPDYPFPVSYEGVYQQRRRASGWALYDAVGIERGNRDQSAAQAARNFTFFGAPFTAIISVECGLGVYGVLDCGLYVQTLLLAAQALGLGAIAQAAPASRAAFLHEWLSLPSDRAVLCAVSFGSADINDPANSFRTDRAPTSETVTFYE